MEHIIIYRGMGLLQEKNTERGEHRVKNICLPGGVEDCRRTLWAAGWPAYPVGGCVRDLLMGRTPGDYDMTTAAPPERVMALFPRSVPTGLKHGTVTVLTGDGPVEVTTFRREGGYADGRHPDAVTFDATLEEDLSRRDFTINAMALGPGGEVIDPFGGREDLERRRIRCVGEPDRRFSEDALRMLRAGRFAAQLGFEMEGDTLEAIRRCAPLAERLSAERVRSEVEKTICSPRPDWVRFFFEAGLLKRYTGTWEGPFAPLARLPAERLARWAGLCAALGREPTPFLEGLKLERRIIRACTAGWRLWKAGLPGCPAEWRRALAEHGEEAVRAAAWMGRWAGQSPDEELAAVLAAGGCRSAKELALSGGDLAAMGYRGRAIGAAQRYLLGRVLERPEDNDRQILMELLAAWEERARQAGGGGQREK